MAGADLTGANLDGVDLREVDLSEANLSGANLREADLTDPDLMGASMPDGIQHESPSGDPRGEAMVEHECRKQSSISSGG